jgi:GNAT superfamily N-acetyltransferase
MAYEVPLAGGYVVSDEPARLDIDMIHRFLSEDSYWTNGRSRATTERSLANSLCFGLYAPDGAQAGFARVVSDRATSAHLADVFVLPDHRGRGLGEGLVVAVLDHPELAGVGRWTLTTRDAHRLYARFGFVPISNPEAQMVRTVPPPLSRTP